jgi:transcription-repair coupling factor (superfamily II helicase)
MPDLQTIIRAKHPLTLASVPAGFAPLLLADLSRAAPTRTLFIAPDDSAMRAIADAVPFFAPELEILQFPAWDCLPYDRASPSLSITSQRMAALQGLQQPIKARSDHHWRSHPENRHTVSYPPNWRAPDNRALNQP